MYDRKLKNLVLKEMRTIFYPKDVPYLDWMGFPIDDVNVPSYHHIEKKEDLERIGVSSFPTIDNGAYLGKKSHEILHQIELSNIELYNYWNNLFRNINYSRSYPDEYLWLLIIELRDKTLQLIENNSKTAKK